MLKICQNCKKFVSPSTTVCPACGNTNLLVVSSPDTTELANKQKKSKSPIILALLAVLIVVGVVGIGITYFLKSGFTVGGNYDFRYGSWGDNRDTIKRLDNELDWLTGCDTWEDDILMGQCKLNEYNADFVYKFDNNKLISGLYLINSSDKSVLAELDLAASYDSFKSYLSKQYGSPLKDEIKPLIDESQITNKESFDAIRSGQVIYITIFESDTADIMLTMDKDPTANSLSINIFYTSNTNYYDGKN